MIMSTTTIMERTARAAVTITTMKNIITTMNTNTITMRTKCSQAGARKHLASIQRKKWRQSSRHLQRRTMNTALSFVQRACCQARTVHGSTSIWSLKNTRSVKDSLNTPDVSVSSAPRLMRLSLRSCLCFNHS